MARKKSKKKDGKKEKKGKKRKGGASRKDGGKSKARAKKAAAASPRSRPAKPAGPLPVVTGKGPGPAEVAARVTELLREGKQEDVEHDWLATGIESVEGLGASLSWRGKKAVLAKYRAWEADHEVHETQVEGPWVGATGFALKFRVDMTQKSTGQRRQMEEIAVYTVRNGKITREEFHFPAGG